MNHQIIKKSGKPEYAVLPYEEYEKLVQLAEDAEDISALMKAAKRDEERLPHAFVKELINIDQPLSVWRKYRGLSQQKLAEKSGVTQAYIAQIETGKKGGGVKTLKKLAVALSIGLDDLVTD
ncbi:MAG: helix-turn-helix domain-containing protein [Proteobacteria bacterium]|nr:helix-turn-helix domain-containing protein [Pseudomonadota bacterium]